MPTIKTKKEMNLPQLIEWVFSKRNLDDEIFLSNKHNSVHVTDDGILEFFGTFYNDTFTVEIEEEITEDTVIPRLFVRYVYESFAEKYEVSLTDVYTPNVKAVYLSNNDLTMTLIWTKEKGLVE